MWGVKGVRKDVWKRGRKRQERVCLSPLPHEDLARRLFTGKWSLADANPQHVDLDQQFLELLG